MNQVTTIGIDLAKSVFQLHGIAGDGAVILRKKLRRGQMLAFFSSLSPCLIGMECQGLERTRRTARHDHVHRNTGVGRGGQCVGRLV